MKAAVAGAFLLVLLASAAPCSGAKLRGSDDVSGVGYGRGLNGAGGEERDGSGEAFGEGGFGGGADGEEREESGEAEEGELEDWVGGLEAGDE